MDGARSAPTAPGVHPCVPKANLAWGSCASKSFHTCGVQSFMVTTTPRPEPQQQAAPTSDSRGLTLRSVVITLFSLLLMGAWIEYEECFSVGGPLAENSPPNGAVGVILILLLISAGLYRLHRSLGLRRAELVVIYSALLVAAPIMTQGMWHRLPGLLGAFAHEQDFKSYESFPKILWPHGSNLVQNGQFTQELEGFTFSGSGKLAWAEVEWKGKARKSPVLDNGTVEAARSELQFTIPQAVDGKAQLVPGESFLLSLLVKADGLQPTSSYAVRMRADAGPWTNVYVNTAPTAPTFANPGGFMRVGVSPLNIPSALHTRLTFAIGLTGPGSLTVQDVEFLNSMAVEGAYVGRKIVRAADYDKLGPHERDFTLQKPDNMWSLAGLRYLFVGFVPWDQWITPLLTLTVLIGALFLGFLGFNVIMRRQWVENERFTFPMNIFPRHLFGEESTDELGQQVKGIFHNKIMWIGFAVTLPLVLLKGIHFYFPEVPAPTWSEMWPGIRLDTYFTSPTMKAYLQNVQMNTVFCLLAITLLVEKDILFSIWTSFLLFQFLYMFGKVFNFNQYAGYPWEWQQAIGSFIAFAVLAIFVARRHLQKVFRHIFGAKLFDESEEIMTYRTALLCIIASVVLIGAWGMWTKMGLVPALLFFCYMLICGFAASKIRAECGAAFAYWLPYFSLSIIGALGGFAMFGATGMVVATLASGFMCTSCFLFIAPVQVEMMELGRVFRVRPRDIGWGLFLGLIGGIFVGGFAILVWTYGIGADNMAYGWPYGQSWYYNGFRQGELSIDRAFAAADGANLFKQLPPENQPLNFVTNLDAKGIGIGFVVTCVLSALRSLFTWFPLHPLGYVLATTFFARSMWFTCFLAWLIRLIVQRIGGAHSVRCGLVPFAVGMFLACILSIVLFDVIGFYLRSIGITEIYSKWP